MDDVTMTFFLLFLQRDRILQEREIIVKLCPDCDTNDSNSVKLKDIAGEMCTRHRSITCKLTLSWYKHRVPKVGVSYTNVYIIRLRSILFSNWNNSDLLTWQLHSWLPKLNQLLGLGFYKQQWWGAGVYILWCCWKSD